MQMSRAFTGAPRALRIFTVIFTIAAMLCVSAVSLSAAHNHANEPADRCTVCYAAHFNVSEVPVVQALHGPEVQNIAAPAVVVHRVESRRGMAVLSRGPPSSL